MWMVGIVCGVSLLAALTFIPVRVRLTWQTPAKPRARVSVAWPIQRFHVVIPMGAADRQQGVKQPVRHRTPSAPDIEETRSRPPWTEALSVVSLDQVRLVIQVCWIVIIEGVHCMQRAFRVHRLVIHGEYGGHNPAVTGQVYGWTQALSGGTSPWLTVQMTPNFMEPGFVGSCELLGSILIYRLIWFPFAVVIALIRRLTVRSMRDILRGYLAMRRARRPR